MLDTPECMLWRTPRGMAAAGFLYDSTHGFGGNFNLYGVMTFVFVRSALQLHANSGVRA
mgnify:CR=1 FL=1